MHINIIYIPVRVKNAGETGIMSLNETELYPTTVMVQNISEKAEYQKLSP